MTDKEKKDLHLMLIKWLGDAEQSTAETLWMEDSTEDYKFYAGDQDTDEVKEALDIQKRPITVYNEIKPKVDMLVGMAAQMREAPTLLPRGFEDEPLAELGSGALAFFRTKLRIERLELGCLEHTVKAGRSFQYFFVDNAAKSLERIKTTRLPGRFVHVDPDSIEYDLSDARYVFVDKWLPEEDIKAIWPRFETESINQVHHGASNYLPAFFNEANEKHRLVEVWWRKLERYRVFINPLTGEEDSLEESRFKAFQRALRTGLETPDGETIQIEELPSQKVWKKNIHFAILGANEILETGASPYRHEMFPLVQYGAYKDEENNRWLSVISVMKDPQRGLNTTRRQLVHLLQTAPKGILQHEVGAVLNIEDYEENSSTPGFHMELAKGGLSKIKFSDQPQISPIYGQLDGIFQQSMKDSSGIQDSLMGIQTSSREPGITVQMRQDSGVAVVYTLFDNYKESKYLGAKILFSLIQQFCTEEMLIRIEGSKGYELLQLNSQLNPELDGFNDIGAGEFDLIIAEDVVTKSMRLAVAQMLTEFGRNNPGTIPPDLIMEYTNLPFSAKQRVKEFTEALRAQEQENFDREMELKEKEVEAKITAARAKPDKGK